MAHKTNWTTEMLTILTQKYSGGRVKDLVKDLNITYPTIRKKAKELGLIRNPRASCNQYYFDTWTPGSAYTLGFIFADGNITKSLNNIVIALVPDDISVLDYIKAETQCRRHYYWTKPTVDDLGHKRRGAAWLTLASRRLVQKAIERGVKPAKTYLDEPFPNVPAEMLPHFIRGYFDGDGTAIVYSGGQGCRVSFIGSNKFIQGLYSELINRAGLSQRKVKTEQGTRTSWSRVGWVKAGDVEKFYNYIYPEGFPFCLERKRKKIKDWLDDPRTRAPKVFWTSKETALVKKHYNKIGPAGLVKLMPHRTYSAIRYIADKLGFSTPKLITSNEV